MDRGRRLVDFCCCELCFFFFAWSSFVVDVGILCGRHEFEEVHVENKLGMAGRNWCAKHPTTMPLSNEPGHTPRASSSPLSRYDTIRPGLRLHHLLPLHTCYFTRRNPACLASIISLNACWAAPMVPSTRIGTCRHLASRLNIPMV